MKKAKLFLVIFVLLFVLCSCEELSKDSSNENIVEITEIVKTTNNIAITDIYYNMRYDSQNYFYTQYRSLAAADTGYYFFSVGKGRYFWLMYYDKFTHMCIPVCNRTDCGHDDMYCDAYFGNTDGRIWYYDESLYYMDSIIEDGTITYILYKVTLDGSVRSRVCELYTQDYDINQAAAATSPEITIHRGYIYFSLSNREVSYLYIMDINSEKEPKEICRCSGYYTGIYNMQGYGNGIMFECYYYKEETADEYDVNQKIFYYSQDTGNVSLLADGNLGLYAVTEDSIVYSDGKDMLMYSLKDYTIKTLVENEADTASYDGKYIYLDNMWECSNGITDISERKIDVYDTDGIYIDTIDMSGNEIDSDFGDENYLFQEFMEGDEFTLYAFDKSQLGTDSNEWIKVKYKKHT